MAVVFVVPAMVTLQLKHVGERGIRAEKDLEGVMTELQIQDGFEWRVISGRVTPDEVRPELAASRQRARSLVQGAGLGAASTTLLSEVSGIYERAVDEELRLLEIGEDARAEEFDEAQVDPAFARTQAALAGEVRQLADDGRRARLLSDGGLIVTVLGALTLTTVLQSRRRRAEVGREAERRTEDRHRALIDQSADLVFVTDRDGAVQYVSPSAERVLAGGHIASRGTGADGAAAMIAAIDPADRAALVATLQQVVPGAGAAIDIRVTGLRQIRSFEVSVRDLTGDASIGGIVITAHDVTDRIALQKELEHRAMHDALTGLPNRALLLDRLEQALRADQRDGTITGLILIDLDRFKEVNDTFGHHYGDALLIQIGQRFTGVLRDVDTVARLGGDEFMVLLPDVRDVEAVLAVAVKLTAVLEAPFPVEGVELDVEASMGAVVSGGGGPDATTLLRRTDVAMYVAKARGLRMFAYDPSVDGNSPMKLALLGDLRRALDRHELVLYYQPKVSLSTGDVVGAEALIRWLHPSRGLVLPDAFIPVAEHTGLIGPLTRFVLDTALAQCRAWADAGHPLNVSVNLSARNLHDDSLPEHIAELLAVHGVPAARLELEITESAIVTEPARARQLLDRLCALGVRLSIDDFGAGYTSIGQLKTLPVTELKIDQSFVMTMDTNRDNAMIVQSVIELGHNLGLTLVAEGVENAAILTSLESCGCDVAQGYCFTPPIPAVTFDAWRAQRATTAASYITARPTTGP